MEYFHDCVALPEWKVNFGCNHITVYQTRTDPAQPWTKLTCNGASCSGPNLSCCGSISCSCWWHKSISGKRKRFLIVNQYGWGTRELLKPLQCNKSESEILFLEKVLHRNCHSRLGSMVCSACACWERYFCQEKGTNNAFTGAVSLLLENWSHLPEFA